MNAPDPEPEGPILSFPASSGVEPFPPFIVVPVPGGPPPCKILFPFSISVSLSLLAFSAAILVSASACLTAKDFFGGPLKDSSGSIISFSLSHF